MRDAIAAIPDGIYRFEDVMDDDGLGTIDIPIRLAVTSRGRPHPLRLHRHGAAGARQHQRHA